MLQMEHRGAAATNYIYLDISGNMFKLSKRLIERFPNALLATLIESVDKSIPLMLPDDVVATTESANTFFVQRSPALFEVILQCYISGQIHIPEFVCEENVLQEMAFWKLTSAKTCGICSSSNNGNSSEEGKKELQMKEEELKEWNTMRSKLWTLLEHPGSSWYAWLYALVTMLFVFVSVTNMVLGSIPELQFCPPNATEIFSASEAQDAAKLIFGETNITDEIRSDFNQTQNLKPEGVLGFFSNCWGMQMSEIVEMVCTGWFSVELALRFFSCPDRRAFLRSALNLIDCFATLRYYVELLLWAMGFNQTSGLLMLFRIIRTLNMLRILKLARYHEDLRILGETLLSAQKEIGMLFVFILVTLLMYSSIIFNLEKDVEDTHFVSIPASVWWSIATLTTVGYGDMVPVTLLGKLLGGCACVTGILMVGLPMSVLVDTFASKYKNRPPRRRRPTKVYRL